MTLIVFYKTEFFMSLISLRDVIFDVLFLTYIFVIFRAYYK